MKLLILPLLLSLGCASADGHPPSPEAQHEPSTDVDACVRDASLSVRQTERFYEVTRAAGASASGGVRTFAQLLYAEGPPPFVVDFGDVLAEVRSDLTVCVH